MVTPKNEFGPPASMRCNNNQYNIIEIITD